MKPKEGTILTVARSGSEKAVELCEDGEEDLERFFCQIIEHMEYTLGQTPDMLPVLKEAGVVDSGGQGLLELVKGAYDVFCGKEISYEAFLPQKSAAAGVLSVRQAEITFGYCTEFIIMTEKPVDKGSEDALKAYLESIGDSIVVVADEEVIKVHVHTNDPGLAIQKALSYGALSNMKIDNMRLEHQETLFRESAMSDRAKGQTQGHEQEQTQERVQEGEQAQEQMREKKQTQTPRKDVGFAAVSVGEGLGRIFCELGVDYVIEGGQTMNPSTEDLLCAVERVNADTVFLFPNNKNIIMAANQAREMAEDTKVIVIPTKTVPQGIAAAGSYVPGLSEEEIEAAMLEEIAHVRTGQVTYAVRDTSVNGREIRQGDYMGIGDDGIVAVGGDLELTALETVGTLVDESVELLSIYYGNEVSQEDAESLKAKTERKYPDIDIELQDGGQPVYYYLLSAE